MRPAEMGLVLHTSIDDPTAVSATILDLAVRGTIRIVERPFEGLRFLGDCDYDLVLDASGLVELEPFEQKLVGIVFDDASRIRVTTRRYRLGRRLYKFRWALDHAVVARGWFRFSPAMARTLQVAVGLVLLLLGLYVGVEAAEPEIGATLALMGAIAAIFCRTAPRRTGRGRAAREWICDFREFVTRIDVGVLELTGGRTPSRFERILPYALVLGLADEWADAFADVDAEPPDWYAYDHTRPDFRRFVVDVRRAARIIGGELTSRRADI